MSKMFRCCAVTALNFLRPKEKVVLYTAKANEMLIVE